MQKIILLFITLCMALVCNSQTDSLQHYGMKDGLPSETVYQCLEDDQHFLWIATDQGIARFDGRKCQVYGKKEGVPDNEVLQMVKEKNGRLWIRCLNQSVAFFNQYQNKFIDITEMASQINILHIESISAPEYGGIQFETTKGSYYFSYEAGQLPVFIREANQHIICKDEHDIYYTYSLHEQENKSILTINSKQQHKILAIKSFRLSKADRKFDCNAGKLYLFALNKNNYEILSGCSPKLDALNWSQNSMLHPYYTHNFYDQDLNLYYRTKHETNGKDIMEVNVYDKMHGNFKTRYHGNYIGLHHYKDRKGNVLISTLENGIVVYKSNRKITQLMNTVYRNVIFYSLAFSPQGNLLAGNEKGEIIELSNQGLNVHPVARTNKIEWQRNIIISHNKVFTFSDGGVYVNYQKEVCNKIGAKVHDSKCVLALNDTTILSGASSGLCSIHTQTEKYTDIPECRMQISALASINKKEIYIGSVNGLYLWNIASKKVSALSKESRILGERIVGLCHTDELLWIATATNGLLVLKQQKIIAHITEANGLSTNNLLTITRGKKNQIWVGSNQGICKIDYEENAVTLNYTLQNISAIDGLSSNLINQMIYHDGYLYAATAKGVSKIPEVIDIPEIEVSLTAIKINRSDTVLTNYYNLKANQRNLSLQFSGADMHGYFKQVEYSTDEGANWTELENGNLSVEFENGLRTIWARAIDINKNRSKPILVLQFDIAAPFWKKWWFWVITTICLQLALAYILYRRRKIKEAEQRKLESAKAHLASLEQQAFTSLMNPHFMFNSLNSIQHYINHQDRHNANLYLSDFASLIRKNFEAAQQAFIPLEQEFENLSIYLRLEKMRFNDKFNFAIEFDKDLETDDWMMPTMILQPLVENAILHGIMPSKIQGQILLKVSEQHDSLLVEVIDNGIGIENSKALKHGSKHKSRGMELIHKRLHALSFFCKQELKLVYSPVYDDTQNPGNKISLRLPYNLYQDWYKVQTDLSN